MGLGEVFASFQIGPQSPGGEVVGGTEHPLPTFLLPTQHKPLWYFLIIAEFMKPEGDTYNSCKELAYTNVGAGGAALKSRGQAGRRGVRTSG